MAKKASKTFRITGRVISRTTRQGILGLRVEAWDKDLICNDLVGSKDTDEQGAFLMEFTSSYFKELFFDRKPDLFFKVFRVDDLIKSTEDSVLWNVRAGETEVVIEVDIPVAEQPAKSFVVHGTVTDANLRPLAGLAVRAYERDLRHPQFLGSDTTNSTGGFRIAYQLADFQLGELPAHRAPWLIVEVREAADGEVLARQEVPKAAQDQTVKFTLAHVGVVSEWQRISEAVAPLLKGQGTPPVATGTHVESSMEKPDLHPADITAADVDFIVLETGLDRAAVQAWAASSRIVRDASLRLTEEFPAQQAVLHEHGWPFFFAIVRQGLTNDLDVVLRESVERVRQSVRAAVSVHQIPPLNENQVALLLDVLSEEMVSGTNV